MGALPPRFIKLPIALVASFIAEIAFSLTLLSLGLIDCIMLLLIVPPMGLLPIVLPIVFLSGVVLSFHSGKDFFVNLLPIFSDYFLRISGDSYSLLSLLAINGLLPS